MKVADLIIDVIPEAEGLRLRVKPGWEPIGGFSTLVTAQDLRGLAMWLECQVARFTDPKN
jgi:hypothetical protein